MAEQLGMAEAVRTAFVDDEAVLFCWPLHIAVWQQRRNQGIACLEGFLQAIYIVGLAIVEAFKRSNVENDSFVGRFIAIFIGNSDSFYQTEVIGAVILDFFYEQSHHPLTYAYVPTHILYHIPTKKASLFLAIAHFFLLFRYSSFGKLGRCVETTDLSEKSAVPLKPRALSH